MRYKHLSNRIRINRHKDVFSPSFVFHYWRFALPPANGNACTGFSLVYRVKENNLQAIKIAKTRSIVVYRYTRFICLWSKTYFERTLLLRFCPINWFQTGFFIIFSFYVTIPSKSILPWPDLIWNGRISLQCFVEKKKKKRIH